MTHVYISIHMYQRRLCIEKIIKSFLRKVRNRKDISDETSDYFLVNNPKLGRFYLLPKIHKRLYMYQVDLLYLILNITLKIYQHFSNIILSRSHKKLSHILRTTMIF